MKTVAEGVETGSQYDILAKEGCTEVQGRYYSMPLCIEDVNSFLANQPASS